MNWRDIMFFSIEGPLGLFQKGDKREDWQFWKEILFQTTVLISTKLDKKHH